MKEKAKDMLLCAVLFAAILVMVLISLGMTIYRESIQLLDGVSFGMSPWEVERALGEPVSERLTYYEVSDSTYRYQDYEVELLGHPATVKCEFFQHPLRWVLWKCTIQFQEVQDKEALWEQVTAVLKEALGDQERFYVHEYSKYNVDIGANHGPVGTSYGVQLTELGLLILCHCDEYIR